MNRLRLTKSQWLCVLYVPAHTASHFLAEWFVVQSGVATSLWYPPSGLALSLLVLLGLRAAPVVWLTNFVIAWVAWPSRPFWTGCYYPTLLTGCYVVAAQLVRRFVGRRLPPSSDGGVAVFFGVIIGTPFVYALLGTAAAALAGATPHALTGIEFLSSVRDWWIGDTLGLLTVVPAAMVFLVPWLEGRLDFAEFLQPRLLALAALRGATLVGSLLLVLWVPVLREQGAYYLCFLPFVWICVHHGLRGATLASLAVTVVGLVEMRLTGATAGYSYVFLLFEVAVAGVGLGLGTIVTRRNEAEAALAASNAELAHLHQLELDERIAAQLAEEKARLEVLRYQLNPHFLYNSLNSIYGLFFENPRDAGEMVLRLAEFCRATLTGPHEGLPTLGVEIDSVRTYLDIEKVRWGDKLRVEYEVAPAAAATRLPPFLLLPLVENAIKYGSRTSPGVLQLQIRAWYLVDTLHLEIANTGAWLAPDPGRAESTGIGLENLRQRLQRYFPGAHRFSTCEAEGWVVVSLAMTGECAQYETRPRRRPQASVA